MKLTQILVVLLLILVLGGRHHVPLLLNPVGFLAADIRFATALIGTTSLHAT